MLTLHHVDKDGYISSSSIIHTTEVNSYSKLIFIAISINGWTEESYWLSSDISLATLLNLGYFQNEKRSPLIIFASCCLLWLDPKEESFLLFRILLFRPQYHMLLIKAIIITSSVYCRSFWYVLWSPRGICQIWNMEYVIGCVRLYACAYLLLNVLRVDRDVVFGVARLVLPIHDNMM